MLSTVVFVNAAVDLHRLHIQKDRSILLVFFSWMTARRPATSYSAGKPPKKPSRRTCVVLMAFELQLNLEYFAYKPISDFFCYVWPELN